MSRPITSTEGLIRKVSKIAPIATERLYYRGHDDHRYNLDPSLFRNQGHLLNEHVMYRELVASNPGDFIADATTLEALVRMQHYSLPTRLLDITSNPLVALYFACCKSPAVNGDVVVLKIDQSLVKFYDSDTVICIANLAKLPWQDKLQIDTTLSKADFNASDPVKRLLHLIRQEHPHFQSEIEPADLRRIITVRTKMSNVRISAQAGSFLIFGLGAVLSGGTAGIGVETVRVDAKSKAKILAELDVLNVNPMTVFPYVEKSAEYVRTRYQS